MPFELKQLEEVKTEVLDPVIGQLSNSEKFDVLFVIMIVLLMYAFRGVTAFIFKLIGAAIIVGGVFTLLN